MLENSDYTLEQHSESELQPIVDRWVFASE